MQKQTLFTACVTPFNHDGSQIDYKSLERLLRLQEKAGNGILLFGSTGEGLLLTLEERKEILEFVSRLKLKTEIVIGVPSHQLSSALEWLDFANGFNINGYMMTTPLYTKPGVKGQIHWFETLLNRAAFPAFLYNIPGRTGVKLFPEAIHVLKNHPKFFALKDSGGTVDSIVEYKIAAPDVNVYCGDDYMMPSMSIEGASGLVSIFSNAWPVSVRHYVSQCLEGKIFPDKMWWQAGKALFSASNPIPIKALLKDIHLIDHDTVRLPLSQDDLPSRETLLFYHEKINRLENVYE